jgi:hypothetical protein
MSTKTLIPQPEEHALQCAQEYMNFLFKIRFPNGKNQYFLHVFELLEIGETERAILLLSEILRGPRFSNRLDFWLEKISFWMQVKWEQEPESCGGFKPSPYRVFHNLIHIVAYDEEFLRCIVDPPMLK